MKILFVCNQGLNRSKTAAELFKDRFRTESAGLYSDKALTKKQLAWADLIVVMEDKQRTEIAHRFPGIYMQKRILALDISDIYHYGQPELVNILQSRISDLL